jgi:hypothetical protein
MGVTAPRELIGEWPAAHSDFAMDVLHGQFDTHGIERILPGKDVLVRTVDKRTVEVK